MKSFQEFIIEEVSPTIKAAIHPDLHKSIAKSVGSNGARLTVKKSAESDVRDKLHSHLQASGFKRNPVLSDNKASTYQHSDGSKIHLTHYAGSVTVEHEPK